MESNYKNEFEHYIKDNADQYRMFPSDKVWKGIHGTLHTRRKWYGFWLGTLLLMTGAAVTWVMTTQPAVKKQSPSTQIPNQLGTYQEKHPASSQSTAEVIMNLNPFAKPITTQNNPATGNNNRVTPPAFVDVVDIVENLNTPAITVYHNMHAAVKELPVSANENNILHGETGIVIPEVPRDMVDAASAGTKNTNKQTEWLAPYTIESVTNAYQFKKPARKISWQLFVTPTVSYRKLSVNKSLDNPSAFNYPFASLSNINNAVTHKPDMGLQIGLSGRYPITNSLKLRGGLQFNINRYDIKAYAFNGEVATIDLNGGNGNSSISTWTNYRNYAGYRSDWLKNYYFSISAPFGAEVKLIGNKKTNLGIAGTLQPTYIIKDRAYLISTDFKNYAEVPRLVRHVNLNTSFETFVNYTSGKTKWQIGPQVRYQILSSFHNKYPVKENLFDFGVKIGLTLNE